MHLLLSRIKDYISKSMPAELYQRALGTDHFNSPGLMEEAPEEIIKRKEILKSFSACKEALKIINDVQVNTSSTPVPPPVQDDWLKSENGNYPKLSPKSDQRNFGANGNTARGSANGNQTRTQAPAMASRPAPVPNRQQQHNQTAPPRPISNRSRPNPPIPQVNPPSPSQQNAWAPPPPPSANPPSLPAPLLPTRSGAPPKIPDRPNNKPQFRG